MRWTSSSSPPSPWRSPRSCCRCSSRRSSSAATRAPRPGSPRARRGADRGDRRRARRHVSPSVARGPVAGAGRRGRRRPTRPADRPERRVLDGQPGDVRQPRVLAHGGAQRVQHERPGLDESAPEDEHRTSSRWATEAIATPTRTTAARERRDRDLVPGRGRAGQPDRWRPPAPSGFQPCSRAHIQRAVSATS